MPEIVLGDHAVIPAWVVDHASFRRWAYSADYPDRGQFSFIRGRVWVDLSKERRNHNLLKTAIAAALTLWAQRNNLGRFCGDRMLLSNPITGLSTEPDGMFVAWDAFREGRVREVGGDPDDGVDVEGAPDMVLEVVSPDSVHKDTVELFDVYGQTGVEEYWLVNPLEKPARFDLYRRTARGYRVVRPAAGWRKSAVFGASVRLVQKTDPLGQPAYTLETR
jgi:Uma2 family endonuclease